MKVVQIPEFSIIDALRTSLKCTATVGKNNLVRYDMKWSGVRSEHSLWIQQSHVTKKGDDIERSLIFKPWLDSLAGEYTCHLVLKNHPSAMMHNKSFTISGMFVHTYNYTHVTAVFLHTYIHTLVQYIYLLCTL